MAAEFQLDPRLDSDCYRVAELPLCTLLMMNDAQYPWFILVPRRVDVTEIYQLSEVDEAQLWRESRQLSEALMRLFDGDKLNLAALGNMVPQLHLHHIVRYTNDLAWPGPIWGKHQAQPYEEEQAQQRIQLLSAQLGI
ncbi:HIT family protein [Aliidiomarina minuta]|uniref:HIT family protein n=1 Tax=Aliidiomarina minuta TaxID=880057 RepID=A0A432W557_9GAMM|nr:HIT family protein [Aliidiomarina minuta]RUO25198.1 HIT family protein [Aliidiomarina minuta]